MEINLAKFRTEPVYDTMAIWSNWDNRGWIRWTCVGPGVECGEQVRKGIVVVAQMWAAGQGRRLPSTAYRIPCHVWLLLPDEFQTAGFTKWCS